MRRPLPILAGELARQAVARVCRAMDSLSGGGGERAEFLPEAFARETERTLPAARAVVWLSLGLVAASLVWASLASVDRVVTAEGKVRPASHVRIINHPRGGRVAAIHVTSGDHVAEGQALLQFDSVAVAEELNKLRPQRLVVEAELARLVAERDRTPRPEFPPAVLAHPEVAKTQAGLFAQRSGAYEQERQALIGAVQEKAGLLAQQQAKLAHAKRGLSIAEKQERAVLDLARKGYFAKVRAMQVQRDVAGVRSDVAQTEALIGATTAARSTAEAKLAQFERDREVEILGQIAAKQTALEQVSAAIAQLEDQLEHLVLKSPVAGTVEQVKARTIGQAIEPGAVILHIVPDGDDLLVDVRVRNQDIGQIKVGQPVTLKVRAYDYQRFGKLAGRVATVAQDSATDERTGEELFMVRVALAADPQGETRIPRVQSGLVADVDFHVGHRSVASYVLDAVARTADEALRE